METASSDEGRHCDKTGSKTASSVVETASSHKGRDCANRASRLPIEQIDTTTNSRTNDCTRPSYHSKNFDAFLSHSGQQKFFVRQLYKDLTNQGVSCFFDEDRQSLPLAEHFPSRIFEAAETCKVAVLLLSKNFLESKWPMLELSAFLQAKYTTNPNLKILPLFYNISPNALKQITVDNEKWTEFEKSKEERAKMHRALAAVRGINGLKFSEGNDEVKFREEIVKGIWHLLPMPSPRYHVLSMQGEERMCQELAMFFSNVRPNVKGICIAGLYGIAGQGKTTLGKAFCNFKLGDFEGRVCHLELSKGDPVGNIKLALQYLTHMPDSYVQSLRSLDQAKLELEGRVKQQRVLLVLDNLAEDCIDEVLYYLMPELGENSWVLLSARSVDVLEKHFQINKQSCMRVPRLEEEEAITILLERAFPGDSIKLGAQDREFALKCAKRCLFKEVRCDNGQSFHPLALKAFGGYLSSKYCLNLSKWVDEIDGIVGRSGDGLDDVFSLLDKAFDGMDPTYQTIFMLLAVYKLPNMSPHKVKNWLAINCNGEISFIERAVEDLVKMSFIEEFESELRIHDLYMEFAQRKANKMERWLWWKKTDDECSTRGLIPQKNTDFELAKFEQCRYQKVNPKYIGNLLVLQLVEVENVSKLDLGLMNSLRSITLRDCKLLAAVDGAEKLLDLQWLQITGVHPILKLPKLSSLEGLQYLEIDIRGSQVLDQLGDLSNCYRLREIYVVCPSLIEFPRLKSMKRLEKVEFSLCSKVEGPLDCTDCVNLQTVVLSFCCQMAASPLLSGCEKLSKLVLTECHAVTTCPDLDVPTPLKTLELLISSKAASPPTNLEFYSELENLQLWNMRKLMELPSFERLENLTVLKLGKCGIREPPDLTGCKRLQDVYFFSLINLQRFPNFSLLRELKKLSLCDCISVQDPPNIEECHKLQVFHLLYNDNIEGLPKMDKCAQLEEIQVSWRSLMDKVAYRGFDPDSCQVNEELEFCLEYWKDEKFGKIGNVRMPGELKELQCVKGRTILVKRYFRGVRLYYSLTSPYQWFQSLIANRTAECQTAPITLSCENGKVIASGMTGRECQDRDWLNKVQGYFADGEVIVKFRDEVTYNVRGMQGEARMCEEVANFFNKVQPKNMGVHFVGLYGIAGQGKTTLCKAFCNSMLGEFEGKVCYLEFGRGGPLERAKRALQNLIHAPLLYLQTLTLEYQAKFELRRRVKGKRVLLVLDNITEESGNEVKDYLEAGFGGGSWILLSARSVKVLEKYFQMDKQSCMHVPRLREDEAITILLERACPVTSTLKEKDEVSALKCAKRCLFDVVSSCDNAPRAQIFHPLALKNFGGYLFGKYGFNLPKWVAEIDGMVDRPLFAESPWRLEELLRMRKTRYHARFISVFCDVEPYDLRYPDKGVHAAAFAKHEEEGRFSNQRLRERKEALQYMAFISDGFLMSTSNDNVEQQCARISKDVEEVVRKSKSSAQRFTSNYLPGRRLWRK